MKQKIINTDFLITGWALFALAILVDIFIKMDVLTLGLLVVTLLCFIANIPIQSMKNTIYFAKLNPNAIIPTKDKENGCYDLYACIEEDTIVQPHTNKLIPTGIASAFDSKYRIAFRERGSNTKSNSIILAGQIDSGFRGEYFISVYNGNDIPIEITNSISEVEKTEDFIRIPASKAICQFAIEEVPKVKIKRVTYNKLLKFKSERGSGKLGSSGK